MCRYLIYLVFTLIACACKAQSIDDLKAYPPYDSLAIRHIAEIAVNGSEIFLLLPVGHEENGSYRITTSRSIVPTGDYSYLEHKQMVIDSLLKLPMSEGAPIPWYDFGNINSEQLRRFSVYSTCELIDIYFDKNGFSIGFGPTTPITLVVTELILRGVHVYPDRDVPYRINRESYCGD